MKKSFVVRFEKDPESGWWVVTVPSVPGCLTQGRSLAEGRRRIREALALFVDEKVAEKAVLVDDVRLPRVPGALVKKATAARARIEQAQAEAIRTTDAAARSLVRQLGLSVRDAAELLGVSHQRVQQMKGSGRAA